MCFPYFVCIQSFSVQLAFTMYYSSCTNSSEQLLQMLFSLLIFQIPNKRKKSVDINFRKFDEKGMRSNVNTGSIIRLKSYHETTRQRSQRFRLSNSPTASSIFYMFSARGYPPIWTITNTRGVSLCLVRMATLFWRWHLNLWMILGSKNTQILRNIFNHIMIYQLHSIIF